MIGRFARWIWLAIVVVAACGGGAGPSSAATPVAPSPTPVPTLPPTASPTPGSTPPASASASASGLELVVDAGLLDILPSTVGVATIDPDPTTARTLVGNPELTASASGVAMARYIGAGDSGSDDLAIVSVVRLRSGVFSEPFFKTWRHDYDDSACEVAGGSAGTEDEVVIASFSVYTGRCVEGATTYHAHLDGDLLVSIITVGPADLGAGVIAGLRP